MADNTNARSVSIQVSAQFILKESGVDINDEINVQPLARQLADEADCSYDTAKRHIIKAINLAKGIPLPTRGGSRGGGFPKGTKRVGKWGVAKKSD